MLLVIGLLLVIAGVLGWVLGTQSGLNFVVRQASEALQPALGIERAEGRLLGPLQLSGVRYQDGELDVAVDQVRLAWQPRALLQRRLHVEALELGRIDFAQRASTEVKEDQPLQPPDSLQLPLAIDVDRLALQRFVLHDWPAEAASAEAEDGLWLGELAAALHSDGAEHRLQVQQLRFAEGDAAAELSLAGSAPFALKLAGRLALEIEQRPLQLVLNGDGNLLAPRLNFTADSAGMELTGEVEAAPFAAVPLVALRLNSNEINPAALLAELPQAALVLEADLHATADSLLTGKVAVDNRQPRALDEGGIPLQSLSAALDVREQLIRVDELDIALLGNGRIGGKLDWQPPQEPPQTEAAAESALATAKEEGVDAEPDPFAALGQLAAVLQLSSIDMQALDGRLPAQQLNGKLSADAAAAGQQATVELSLGQARIDAALALTPLAASHQFKLDAKVRELVPQAFAVDLPAARLNADLQASGELDRSGQPQRIALDFKLPPSEFEGLKLEGEGALQWLGERLPALKLDLDLAGNRVQASGAWGAAGDVVDFKLAAPALPALGQLAGITTLEGRLDAIGQLGGSLEQPSGRVELQVRDFRFEEAVALQSLSLQGQLDKGLDGPFHLVLQAAEIGEGAAPGTPRWLQQVALQLEGSRADHQLSLNLQTPPAAGVADVVRLQARGELLLPAAGEPGWRGQLEQLTADGRLAARLQAPLALQLSSELVTVSAGELLVGERTRLQLAPTRWTPQQLELAGKLDDFSLDLLAPWLEDDTLAAADDGLVLGAEWGFKIGNQLNGEFSLARTAGRLKLPGMDKLDLDLQQLSALLRAEGNALQLQAEVAGKELGQLSLQAGTRVQRTAAGAWALPPESALQGKLLLDMPALDWLVAVLPENITLAGSLGAEVEIGGTIETPQLLGDVKGQGLEVNVIDQGLLLGGGELALRFDREQVELQQLVFTSANRIQPREKRIPLARLTASPGRLQASGKFDLASGASHFEFSADRLPLLQRADRWLLLSGSGKASGDESSLALDADFRTDAGYIELADVPPPSLSDDVHIVDSDEAEAETGEAFALTADVRVKLGEALYVSALGLETRLGGELTVRLRPDKPMAAIGSINTIGGSFQGYGQQLTIERGVINFQGPLDAPGLDILALRKGLEVEAGVAVTGSAKRPLLRLVSEPNVPDPDKLSWIVLGRAPDSGSGADMALLLPAAQALLGGSGGGMTEELSNSLGLDSFSLGQGELNSTSRTASSKVVGSGSTVASGPASTGQVLSVGKRLGPDLFFSFEQSLGGAETLAKLTYQLSRRLSAVIRSGSDNSVDLHYGINYR
ncbi:MAG: translocation/assembly module TamB domain-containing protein [Thauera sp.]|nr:translocation/assembly module TamB domain-containing protein [Thauera sp.]